MVPMTAAGIGRAKVTACTFEGAKLTTTSVFFPPWRQQRAIPEKPSVPADAHALGWDRVAPPGSHGETFLHGRPAVTVTRRTPANTRAVAPLCRTKGGHAGESSSRPSWAARGGIHVLKFVQRLHGETLNIALYRFIFGGARIGQGEWQSPPRGPNWARGNWRPRSPTEAPATEQPREPEGEASPPTPKDRGDG